MTVFCDSFALIAWINMRDSFHPQVDAWFSSNTGKIVTTEWILVELADAMSKPIFRSAAVNLISRLRNDHQFDVIPTGAALSAAGLKLYAARPDKEWSLTDCISFEVMATRGLTEALTADRHFEQAGFRAIFKI